MFAPQPGIPDWTKQNLQPDPVDLSTVNCAYSCLVDGLNYPECPVHGQTSLKLSCPAGDPCPGTGCPACCPSYDPCGKSDCVNCGPIRAVAESGALIAGTSSAEVEAAVREFVTPAMMAAAQPLVSEDPRPRCGDTYTVAPKFGPSFIVTCNKYEGHDAPTNNRASRRHWNVKHRTGWHRRPEQDGQAN